LCGCDENVQPPFLRCLRFSYVRGKVMGHVVTRDSCAGQCKGCWWYECYDSSAVVTYVDAATGQEDATCNVSVDDDNYARDNAQRDAEDQYPLGSEQLLIVDRGLHECFSLATGKQFAIVGFVCMVVGLLLGCVACIRAKEHQEAFCRFEKKWRGMWFRGPCCRSNGVFSPRILTHCDRN
jgi:hypothetical protein